MRRHDERVAAAFECQLHLLAVHDYPRGAELLLHPRAVLLAVVAPEQVEEGRLAPDVRPRRGTVVVGRDVPGALAPDHDVGEKILQGHDVRRLDEVELDPVLAAGVELQLRVVVDVSRSLQAERPDGGVGDGRVADALAGHASLVLYEVAFVGEHRRVTALPAAIPEGKDYLLICLEQSWIGRPYVRFKLPGVDELGVAADKVDRFP
mmetsp:Transcript_33213/g.75863  ORF Transcript_33213/g.75863 Transcript_33213/m.75863 type:complete len:207 (+) Transcript_33213:2075-2695(+)